MSLSSHLTSIAHQYEEYRANKIVDSTAEVYKIVTEHLPEELQSIAGKRRPYKPEGSTGRGNVTPAPWIALFDPYVTTTAQSGYYVAYLYSRDLQSVYLSLALGVTAFEQSSGNNKSMLKKLASAASRLAEKLDFSDPFRSGKIDLHPESPLTLHGKYDHSSIVAVHYDVQDMPPEAQLVSDLRTMLGLYEKLRLSVGPNVDEDEAIEDVDTPDVSKVVVIPIESLLGKRSPRRRGQQNGQRRQSKAAKKIGDAGERIVLDYEERRLIEAGYSDLADSVRWLADEGETPGYDILSYNEDGSERWIEVKSTTGNKMSSVEITDNELRAARMCSDGIPLTVVY